MRLSALSPEVCGGGIGKEHEEHWDEEGEGKRMSSNS